MNHLTKSVLVATLGLTALSLFAQDAQPRREGGRPGGPGGPRGGSPIVQVLDADKNHELSAEEIAAAATALKSLDKDNDGKLTAEEFRGGRGGPGGGPKPEPTGTEGAPERPRRGSPLMATLDVDGNGELSAEEIANAPGALKTLDKDNDGKLTAEEFGGGGRRGPGEGRPGKKPASA